MKIVQEEIFGPVGVVIKFEDEKDVVHQANDTLYGLAAAVFSQDINRALETAHELKAGTAWVNCANTLNVNVPFGGYKQSGSTYNSSRCPPQNLILITSDLQSVASWENTPCTTTPTLKRCISTWATSCKKFTKANVVFENTDTKKRSPSWVACCLLLHVYLKFVTNVVFYTTHLHSIAALALLDWTPKTET